MRIGPLLACAASTVLVASLVIPASADTAPPPTLYVTGYHGGPVVCNDAWPGTYGQPLCTIQAAANVVVPGQTVIVDINVDNEFDNEDVHLTRSGTPSQPIVFKTGGLAPTLGAQSAVDVAGFTMDGVHDVTIDGFGIAKYASNSPVVPAGISVSNSSDITINHVIVNFDTPPAVQDGVDISGTSSNVTVSRSLLGVDGTDIAIGPGVTNTDVAENLLGTDGATSAVSVNGAANTDITNNTADYTWCPASVFSVAGGSTGTSIQNNIDLASCTTASAVLSVSADSAASTRSDYNIVYAKGDTGSYSWAGTSYATAAALSAATGQGAHDLNANQQLGTGDVPVEKSPAVDSADGNAPGLLATDYNGDRRVDDPATANTGTGVGSVDRGAVELQDPMTLSVSTNIGKAPTGGTVVATLTAKPGWGSITGYTVDFGDGTPPATSTSPTISHVYSSVSDAPYPLTATVTDNLGNATTVVQPLFYGVTVVQPAPLVPILSVGSLGEPNPLSYYADISGSTDSWSLASATCDFGDGTGVQQTNDLGCDHTYAAAGTYRVTMTVTDADGNTASTSKYTVVEPLPVVTPGPGGPGQGGHCATCR